MKTQIEERTDIVKEGVIESDELRYVQVDVTPAEQVIANQNSLAREQVKAIERTINFRRSFQQEMNRLPTEEETKEYFRLFDKMETNFFLYIRHLKGITYEDEHPEERDQEEMSELQ